MSARELGKVESVFFGREGHGILTISIALTFGSTSQGFGGYALDQFDKRRDRRVGTAAGLDFVLRLLDLFQVDELGKAVGKPVYALRENDGWAKPIVGLETPVFDGGRKFLVVDWRNEWFPSEGLKKEDSQV